MSIRLTGFCEADIVWDEGEVDDGRGWSAMMTGDRLVTAAQVEF